ncbi:MAG: MerR family transcriptional regulator, partial [Lachnospiraceae bacterium]|nr:MerR family transcriptional regulator [Lachnospiraceae bacterium]
MQIGEFAKICETKISVLRHYDKEGLLTPDFIDRFTGYRYYRADQIITFKKIAALK